MQINFSLTEGQGRVSKRGWCGIVSWAGVGWRFAGKEEGIEEGGRTCR
jgi:hypothetical protein